MNTIMLIIVIFLGALMAGGAIIALKTRSLVGAVIISGVIGLFASILYLILGAPDVAMTEAAIGSALTTVIFLFAVKKVKSDGEANDD